MLAAASLPDNAFSRARVWYAKMNESRTEVSSFGLPDGVERKAQERITEAMDRVCAEVGQETDEFVAVAAYWVLRQSE